MPHLYNAKITGVPFESMMKLFLLLSAVLQFQGQVLLVESQLVTPTNARCACPGEVLTYFCTVEGGNATIWSGSAFDCAGNSITLTHLSFQNGTSGNCNDGAIVGQSVKVDGTHYTSKLDVTVSNKLKNKNIICSSDNNTIGKSEMKVPVVAAPDSIFLANAQKDKLVFSWNSVTSNNCSGVKYYIISDCGTCPNFTNMTTTACSDLQLTNTISVCQFSVSTAVCDQAEHHSSPAVTVKLKVPNIPQVKIIPSYNSQQALERLFIIMPKIQILADSFYISGNISGSPISYIAHAYPFNGASFNFTLVNLTSNSRENDERSIELPSAFHCPQSIMVNVSISAANTLGEGPHSSPFIIECTNNLVQIVYEETATESSISCVFLNPFDTSEKLCCIIYGLCHQILQNQSLKCNEHRLSRIVTDSVISGRQYCYSAIAGNATYIVKVEGSFTAGFDYLGNVATAGAALPIGIPLAVCMCTTIIIIVMVVVCAYNIKKLAYHRLINADPLEQYLTEIDLHTVTSLKPLKVRSDCKLREYITETVGVEFKRGHTFYEFTNEVENILEGKEVLLQEKRNKKWFKLAPPEEITPRDNKFYGEGITRDSFGDQYRVFIQSFGSGARHLPGGSKILYDSDSDQVQPDSLPLLPICSEYFTRKAIDSDRQCTKFCMQNGLNTTALNIFLTVEHLPEDMSLRDQPPRDVILMDRRSKKFFTGPKAHQMLFSKSGGESQRENKQWKVFVLLKQKKQGLVLNKGSEVLYQDPRYMKGKYAVVEVDKDNVRMSKFIKEKLNCQFEDGRAFYEATENEEDFLYYKKILRAEEEKLQLNHKDLELQSRVEYFYAIDGVPTKGVKPEQLRLEHSRIFIQSTSQGSRCLRKGEKILYLKEHISSNGHDSANTACPGSASCTSEDEHTPLIYYVNRSMI